MTAAVCPQGDRVSRDRTPARYPWPTRSSRRYPSTTLVVLVTYTLTAPFVPAPMMAALALIRPSTEFKVETTGCGCPVGQMVRIS